MGSSFIKLHQDRAYLRVVDYTVLYSMSISD